MPGAGVRFRFEGRLAYFVARRHRPASFTAFTSGVPAHASVKDVVESFGVPHPEVGAILVDGAETGFAARLASGEYVAVVPSAAGAPSILRPAPPVPARFVLDAHLGRLARLLRLTGFDTVYSRDVHDDVLAGIAADDDRILLTRDVGLLMRRNVVHGYWVAATDPEAQLTEVLDRFAARGTVQPFSRCLRCNGILEPVEKAAVLERLEPLTKRYFDEFRRCTSCGQVYWEGSHLRRLEQLAALGA